MLLLDRPRWPAHGTLFAHLVSDTSLAELHRFARGAGLQLRAFDHDHYDVSAADHARLVGLGAALVAEKELVRRLRSSGLRVRPRERTPSPRAVRPWLAGHWDRLLPGTASIGEELLHRWNEPHRRYHDLRHLAQTLRAIDDLDPDSGPLPRLALWFHDAVYRGRAGADEEASAELAAGLLAPILPAAEVAEVARLVLATEHHRPEDPSAAAVSDADLSVLALPAARYQVYVRDVREEYRRIDDATFTTGRLAVVEDLRGRESLFSTPLGRTWHQRALANLDEEREYWRMPLLT